MNTRKSQALPCAEIEARAIEGVAGEMGIDLGGCS